MKDREREFIGDAADAAAEETGRAMLALERCSGDDVRLLAERILRDQLNLTSELRQIAQRESLELAGLDAPSQSHPDLGILTGAEFDRAYTRLALAGHVRSVRAYRREEDQAVDAALRSFVLATLPVLEQHLRSARRVAQRLGLRGEHGLQLRAVPETSSLGRRAG